MNQQESKKNAGTSSTSTGNRFTRPDYLLQGLLTRAKQRVRDCSGRGGSLSVTTRHDDVGGAVELDGVSHQRFFLFFLSSSSSSSSQPFLIACPSATLHKKSLQCF